MKFTRKDSLVRRFRTSKVRQSEGSEVRSQVHQSEGSVVPGADPGIYVIGGALDRRGIWGPPRSTAGPVQRPVGGPGGRSPPEADEN